MRKGFYYGAAVVVGVLPAILLVGPLVYADGSTGERLSVLGAAGLVYALLGAAGGYLTGAWQTGLWLSVPGLLVAVALGDAPALVAASAAVAVSAAAGGAQAGASLRTRKQK